MPGPILLRDLDWLAMRATLGEYGVDEQLARKVFARVHGKWAASLDTLDPLPAKTRQRLAHDVLFPDIEVLERRQASDGFVKYLFRLQGGAQVEAVRIPLPDPAQARDLKAKRRRGEVEGLVPLATAKYSVCISSQVGCALACAFCATGRMGFARNLATWEMLAQVQHIVREADHPVRGVLFLGMGEPLLNYENVLATARILSHPAGLAIAADAISLSTAGVVPAIRRLAAEKSRFRLIVSLAAPTSGARIGLMPVEKRWPLEELVAAVRDYAIATRDRVTIAYVALSGVNMTREHARDLAALFASVRIKVNLIDVNDPTGQFQPPSEEEVGQFRQELFQFHIPLVRRYAGGSDIGAACGTLAATREGGSLLEAPIEAGRGQEITEPHRLTVPTGYPRMDTEEG